MGDLFSNRKQSVCDKSLLRVRGIEAVQAEIKETEEAVLQWVKEARQFVEQSRKMGLVRRLAYRTIPVRTTVSAARIQCAEHLLGGIRRQTAQGYYRLGYSGRLSGRGECVL